MPAPVRPRQAPSAMATAANSEAGTLQVETDMAADFVHHNDRNSRRLKAYDPFR